MKEEGTRRAYDEVINWLTGIVLLIVTVPFLCGGLVRFAIWVEESRKQKDRESKNVKDRRKELIQ